MGVYIKGMEMPKSCGDCKAFVCYRQWAGDVGDCFCGITQNDAEAKKKNADCPLVHVPPHGKLIDADALMEKFLETYTEYERKKLLVFYVAEVKQEVADMITDAPTIIPASEEGET